MQDEHIKRAETHTERRPAVWPWLLIPLVTLALFFALKSVRQHTLEHAGSATAPSTQSAPDATTP